MISILLDYVKTDILKIIGDRVLLKPLSKEEMSTMYGMLHLPESSAQDRQSMLQAEVVALGVDCNNTRDILRPGDRVICPRWKRTQIDSEGEYWLTAEDDLLAIIQEEE